MARMTSLYFWPVGVGIKPPCRLIASLSWLFVVPLRVLEKAPELAQPTVQVRPMEACFRMPSHEAPSRDLPRHI